MSILAPVGASRTVRAFCFSLVILFTVAARGQMQLLPGISTTAGTGTASYSGDGGAATSATLNAPYDVVFDSAGNYYITDYSNARVRKVSASTGIITTVAGNGTAGFAGDNGQATSASLNGPNGIAVDSSGNLFIVDSGNARIRKVTATTGVITTIAGTGTAGYSGDGGAATSAKLSSPYNIVVDTSGNLYIADGGNHRVRKVTAGTGIITTIAGNGTSGYTGDGAAATSAELNLPVGTALDATQSNLYVSDAGNATVRKIILSTGIISTVAGNGTNGHTGDNGAATSAELYQPSGVTFDGYGNIFIAEFSGYYIRKVNIGTGIITSIAGIGSSGATGDGGPAIKAQIGKPGGIAFDGLGNLFIVDNGNSRIRKVQINTTFPTTALGNTSTAQNLFLQTTAAETITSFTARTSQGPAQEYTVGTVSGCTANGSTSNASGTVCTIPITFSPAYPGVRNVPLTVVTGGGTVTFGLSGIGTGPLVALTPGIISTVAGNGGSGSGGNGGAATSALLNNSAASLVDSAGNLYIADRNNSSVRVVSASTGIITAFAGTGSAGFSGDGGAATSAQLNAPEGLAMDSAGNVYISETGNNRIRKVTVGNGIITTYAGNGTAGYTGDGGAATSAELNSPIAIALDTSGNLYIADSTNNRVRFVNAGTGVISTVAGNGNNGSNGDGGAATSAQLSSPYGVSIDPSGNLYIGDHNNNKIRKVTASTGIISTFAGTGTAGYTGDGGAATSAQLNSPWGVVQDSAGNTYIAGNGDARIRMVNAATGTITTIAGTGAGSYSGDAGAATSATIRYPEGLAISSSGNLYITDAGNNRIRQLNVNQSLLAFPTSTQVGSQDSTDNPMSATVTNIGNANLTVPPPGSGQNPSVGSYFTLASSTTCPQLYSASSSQTISSAASCVYGVNFGPTAAGSVSSSVVLTNNSLGTANSTQTIRLTGTATNTTPTITWTTPSAITYGTALTSTQLDATASVPGTFAYTPASGVILGAGTQTLSVTFTPNDNVNYSTATQTVSLTVNKATPAVTWFPPAAIGYGVALSATQLNASSGGVAGTMTYSPAQGTILSVGSQTLSVTFTPSDTTDYTSAVQSVPLTVNKGAVSISGISSLPASIYGDNVTISFTFTGGGVTPTGTTTIKDGTVVLATVSLSSGVAATSLSTLSSGTHTLTAVYNGDTNYQ